MKPLLASACNLHKLLLAFRLSLAAASASTTVSCPLCAFVGADSTNNNGALSFTSIRHSPAELSVNIRCDESHHDPTGASMPASAID
eukprot:2771011-Amphidinium_carterae.1